MRRQQKRQEEDESLCFCSVCARVNKVFYCFVCAPFDIEEWECECECECEYDVHVPCFHILNLCCLFAFSFLCFLCDKELLPSWVKQIGTEFPLKWFIFPIFQLFSSTNVLQTVVHTVLHDNDPFLLETQRKMFKRRRKMRANFDEIVLHVFQSA